MIASQRAPLSAPGVVVAANAAMVAATAQLLMAAIHEAGHGLVAQGFGFAPRIYAFYEDNPTGTKFQDVLILAAGPLMSLLTGLLFFAAFGALRRRHGLVGHCLLWLAILSVMTFVNYLIVTPWLAAGDTAQLADRFGLGTPARYGVALVGVALLVALARPVARAMLATAPADASFDTALLRKRYVRTYFYMPLIYSLPLVAAAGIGGKPIIVAYGLLATLGNLDIMGAAILAAGRVAAPSPTGVPTTPEPTLEPARIAMYLVVLVFYIFGLSRGLPI